MDEKQRALLTKWTVAQSVANQYLEEIYGPFRKHISESVNSDYYILEQATLMKYKSNHKKQERELKKLYLKRDNYKNEVLKSLADLRRHARLFFAKSQGMKNKAILASIQYLRDYVDKNINFEYEDNATNNRD